MNNACLNSFSIHSCAVRPCGHQCCGLPSDDRCSPLRPNQCTWFSSLWPWPTDPHQCCRGASPCQSISQHRGYLFWVNANLLYITHAHTAGLCTHICTTFPIFQDALFHEEVSLWVEREREREREGGGGGGRSQGGNRREPFVNPVPLSHVYFSHHHSLSLYSTSFLLYKTLEWHRSYQEDASSSACVCRHQTATALLRLSVLQPCH